jgi:hypothetical protein
MWGSSVEGFIVDGYAMLIEVRQRIVGDYSSASRLALERIRSSNDGHQNVIVMVAF